MFVGARSKTADESMKKFQLATGVRSPSDFARDSRGRSSNPTPNAKARLMERSAAVANIFHDRYLTNGTSKMSIDNVDRLMKESYVCSSSGSYKPLVTTSGKLLHSRWDSSHCLGASQLLVALKQGMYYEEPRLQFNYFGMHKRCTEIFRLIQTKEDYKFKQYFTARYMTDDTMIAKLTHLICTVAQGSAKAIQQFGLQERGGPQTVSRIVLSCEEVLEKFLKANDDKACKELKAFCMN